MATHRYIHRHFTTPCSLSPLPYPKEREREGRRRGGDYGDTGTQENEKRIKKGREKLMVDVYEGKYCLSNKKVKEMFSRISMAHI